MCGRPWHARGAVSVGEIADPPQMGEQGPATAFS